jgi:hypothetical protein
MEELFVFEGVSTYAGIAENLEYQLRMKQEGWQKKSNRRSFDSPPPN